MVFACNETVEPTIRVALFFNHKLVSDTGPMPKVMRFEGGEWIAKGNAAAPCRDGIYQGWGEVNFVAGPNYVRVKGKGGLPNTGLERRWGPAVKVVCKKEP